MAAIAALSFLAAFYPSGGRQSSQFGFAPLLRVVEKKGIRSLLESRTKRPSRESFDELPSLDATTEAAIDEALTSSNH